MIGTPRFQQGSLIRVKNKTTDDTWYLRFYEEVQGKRVYRKRKIGTVRQFPHRRDAEKAVLALRAKINSEVRSPETVNALITHYLKHELTTDSKAFSTVETNTSFLKLYVARTWGEIKLNEVKTVAVEKWLSTLPLAPATRTKIKAVFSAIFAHAIRHEWLQHNPIHAVRSSSKRKRDKDVLTPKEFSALIDELGTRDRLMVLLAGSTGLRRSEFIGLRWKDLDCVRQEIAVTKSCVRNHIGGTKTEASRRPVPMHTLLLEALMDWRRLSEYSGDEDFIFASHRLKGQGALSPDTVLKKVIRPALTRAGVANKVVGWHTFRHSLATNLRSLGIDIKVAQEILRHANSRTTLDIYTHAVSSQKREATDRIVELLLPTEVGVSRSAPFGTFGESSPIGMINPSLLA